MRLLELKGRRVIVVYGGGFQPFHEGHMSSYTQAKEAFPGADFYVAASNVTSERPIPFTEKKFLAQQAGVRDPFVQVGTMSYVNDTGRKVTSTPLNPLEVLKKYNPENDVLVIVRSERDPMKTTATSYYQPFTDVDSAEGFGTHAYIYVTKKHDFSVGGETVYSGSQVRQLYGAADDAGREQIISQLYPNATNPDKVKQVLDKRIGNVAEQANPVTSKEKATTVSPVLGKDPKQHPYKGRLVGESAEELHIGDPVIITGNVNYKGKTGDVVSFGKDGKFVVVDLYNYGKHSFHSSDVSYNDYADEDLDEASLATMRAYFAGDRNAKDELEITKQRKYYTDLEKKEKEKQKAYWQQKGYRPTRTVYEDDVEEATGLSPELLARYKKAAGADASKADKEGDVERGNKRFSGIVRATKKEFDNDAKGRKAS